MIWAHRGASVDAPENTLAAFDLAARQGADGIELDVQLSADGVVVVCHDETLERTTDGSGAIAQMTLAQLRTLDASGGREGFVGARMPTLDEVFDLVADTGMVVNVELKNSVVAYPGLEAAVEATLSRSRLAGEAPERVIYSSFNHRSLALLATTGTSVPLGVLHVEPMVRPWDYARSFGAGALHPYWGSVGPDEVAAAHAAGVRVHPWTIDAPEQLADALARGVDAVITNVPARARALLER